MARRENKKGENKLTVTIIRNNKQGKFSLKHKGKTSFHVNDNDEQQKGIKGEKNRIERAEGGGEEKRRRNNDKSAIKGYSM